MYLRYVDRNFNGKPMIEIVLMEVIFIIKGMMMTVMMLLLLLLFTLILMMAYNSDSHDVDVPWSSCSRSDSCVDSNKRATNYSSYSVVCLPSSDIHIHLQ